MKIIEKPNPRIAFLLLAAGSSSRMGQPKQLLSWKNLTLLEHTVNQVKSISNLDIFVVLGASKEVILNKVNRDHVSFIINPSWEKGMGSSLSFGVQNMVRMHSNYHAILVTTVDQPLIELKEYNILINRFLEFDDIIVSKYSDSIGVPAIFPKKYFNELQFISGNKGAKNLLLKYKEKCKAIDFGEKIVDIDTLEVYQSLHQEYGLK